MTDQEMNRAVQYVTASTSYGRETVAEIVRMACTELATLRKGSVLALDPETSLEYVCQWTIKRSGHPEPLVREVLSFADRWLKAVYQEHEGGGPPVVGETDQE